MNNEENVVPAATETVAAQTVPAQAVPQAVPQPAAAPQPAVAQAQRPQQVEVVVQRDSVATEQAGREADAREEAASTLTLEQMRQYTPEQLLAMGVPAASIPQNAASNKPDVPFEVAAQFEELARQSPTGSYVVDNNGEAPAAEGEANGEGGNGGGQAVG